MEASPRVSEEDSGAKLAAIAAQADAWTAQPGVSLEHLLSLTHGMQAWMASGVHNSIHTFLLHPRAMHVARPLTTAQAAGSI